MKERKVVLLLFLIAALLLVACSPQAAAPTADDGEPEEGAPAPEDDTAGSESGAESDEPSAEEAVSVGVFVDNAFGDRAFFDIALDGITLIEENYGVTTNQYEGRLQPDNFIPILTDAANNNELVFVLGFEAIDAMLTIAEQHPETTFVFLDAPIDSPAVASLAYKDQEGCFVAGALAAALTSRDDVANINAEKVVGFVGGVDAPVIQRCLAGYQQGAAHVDPEVTVENIFVGSFVDPAKGKEANLTLVDLGSDINYQYAGLSGEGGFNAAKEGTPLYVIGAGFDQRWLAPDQTVGSMLKRVDLSIDYLTQLYLDGELEKGETFFWGLAEGGVPFTFSEDIVPADVVSEVRAIEEQITAGEIVVEDPTSQ